MIVIYAPYGRNEVTAAAIRVADLALGFGMDLRFVATGPHESNVHSFWDSKVLSLARRGAYDTALGANHCVWFTPSALDLHLAKAASGKARHTVVPSWHSVRPANVGLLREYDYIVAPCKQCYRAIRARCFGGEVPSGKILSWVKWTSGLAFTPRCGLVEEPQRRLLFCVDAASVDECPAVVISVIDSLLLTHEDVAVTMLCAKSWCRSDRKKLKSLSFWQSHRFTLLYQKDFQDQIDIFQQHDVLILPGVKSDFGITAARGLSCGLPVVCFDVSPFSDHVTDGRHGCLVPCEAGQTWLNAPVAAASSVCLLDRCDDLLRDADTLLSLQAQDWGLSTTNAAFEAFWSTLLGL